MTIQRDLIGEAGLQFFGRMTASISHELKNVLAIIRENSGLLDDYLHMMARGTPVDPQRFQTVAQRIEAQTRRADAVIQDLNQFAHCVDSPGKPVDLNQILMQLVRLHLRPAAMQQVALDPRPADSPVVITTSPFGLLNALGLGLAFALGAVPAGGAMTISVDKFETMAEVCFGRLTNLSALAADSFPTAPGRALLAALGAQAHVDPHRERIVITLPLL
jgi:C4-dicarboxylate-specific signal transduction histidine kinase